MAKLAPVFANAPRCPHIDAAWFAASAAFERGMVQFTLFRQAEFSRQGLVRPDSQWTQWSTEAWPGGITINAHAEIRAVAIAPKHRPRRLPHSVRS